MKEENQKTITNQNPETTADSGELSMEDLELVSGGEAQDTVLQRLIDFREAELKSQEEQDF
ncbi:hypothetical protein GTQ43_25490 [Nostoc sp. KVJ3]|uniref:hypothetical protein n=1 Tax=Nostoc sp. KVJ3 TaxID=457945 RepID=UPI0022376B77|nr:hypothetical protein [Nostoc sp. KVJ3]MCW5317050.1 hypothetical protein [Nostoc sp. KVJ3]